MERHFNLATEPWIPVAHADGQRATVSLRSLIAESPRISDIEIYPPVSYAVLVRIAAAIVLRSQGAPLGDPSPAQWQQWGTRLLSDGPDTIALDAYLDEWAEQMWLVHPTSPFLQDATIAAECEKRSTTNKLRMDVASGNNFLWWTKTPDADAPSLDHASAAFHLLAQWGYGSGGRCAARSGKADSKQSPLRPRTQFIPRGSALWPTLLMCCTPAVGDHELAGRDQCHWERQPGSTPVPGQLGRLTMSTRGLLLFGDAGGINDAVITWGDTLPDTFFDSDVLTARRRLKDGTTGPYQLPDDRLAWAELPPLLATVAPDSNATVTRPAALDPSANPIGQTAEFFAAGVTAVTHFADKSKDIDWSRAELPAVLAAVEEHDPDAYGRISQFCRYADAAIGITHKIARSIAAPDGTDTSGQSIPDASAFKRQLWLDAESGFWGTAHGGGWEESAAALRQRCISRFEQSTLGITDPRRLAGAVLAERKLRSSLRHLDEVYGLAPSGKGAA